ncbi:hypothetical protein LCGC14_1519820, partial [marine sediment metagenome]
NIQYCAISPLIERREYRAIKELMALF